MTQFCPACHSVLSSSSLKPGLELVLGCNHIGIFAPENDHVGFGQPCYSTESLGVMLTCLRGEGEGNSRLDMKPEI